ncbi:MAG TPA: RodZ domain-containing protein [Burkholderiales bacterium]|nr:RodZ domain-containing protein [Burkholderiales bacterium]
MNSAEFSASADSAAVPTAGEQLAAARQSRGMSIGEIAQQLKLSPWQVEALESNDVKRLPSPVFVRGFIRNYARLLKLDPALVMPVVEHHVSAAPLTHATLEKSAEIPFPAAGHTNWSRYAIAAAVVLIPLAVYEFYPTDGSEPDVKSDGVQPPVQAVAESASASGLTVATAPLLTTAVDELKAASRPPAGAEAAALTRRAPGEQIVKLHFTRASWVEIRDRNGQKIFSQLNEAGTDQVISGLAPLSLVVGNANGVQLTHNEQPVNLEPYIKVDVARLTLK